MSKKKFNCNLSLGSFRTGDSNCEECEKRELCETARQAIRRVIGEKLDGGCRSLITGFLWTGGDALASSPTDDVPRIIMLCEAYMHVFGITEMGATGFMDSSVYDTVQSIHDDLIEYVTVMDLRGYKDEFEFIDLGIPRLKALQQKYDAFGKPTKIITDIKQKFYSKDVYPVLISHITTVMSMDTGFGTPFNNGSVQRFRNANVVEPKS